MPITFHVQDSDYRLSHKRKIAQWIRAVATTEGFATGPLAVIFCSPSEHLQINLQFLGHDYDTDIITFDYSDTYTPDTIAGDIFINPEKVAQNAAQLNINPPIREMHRVIIHGILHLCRHDDKTPAQQRKMRSLEDKYLKLLKI